MKAHVAAVTASINEAGDRFLVRFVNLWIVVGLVIVVTNHFAWSEARPYTAVAVLMSGVLARIAIHVGHLLAARYLIVGSLSIAAVIVPYAINGIRSPVIASWPLLILLAGWLLGKRSALFLAIVAVVSITVIWQVEARGLLPPGVSLREPYAWWRTLLVIFLLTAVTIWHWVENYNEVHDHERELREQLNQANAALTQQLTHTDNTLSQVRTDYEKAYPMAMMAAVIPSVAHDLNTPVGNAGMAASTLSDHLAQFKKQIEGGSLRRSDLDAFLKTCSEGLRIIETANRRAGELVGSLKQMSVDQATQQRRSFAVDQLISEVMTTLAPSLKKRQVAVVQDIAPGLRMDSFPGPLGQIITNLVQNALVHGFDERPSGTITLRARSLNATQLRIEVEDDGIGMTDEIRQQIFQSFFTTKLGRGGSGIGLTFSKRLIEEALGGTISVESTPAVGSRFVLDMPLSAPTESAQARLTAKAAEDNIEISEASFRGSAFRPHGRYSAKCDGQLVIMEASGPFNTEMLVAYHQATLPLLAKVRARGPFVTLTEYHDSMMMSPDAVALLAKSVAQATAEHSGSLAVAYAVDHSVEGRELMITLIESTVFAPQGRPFKAFDNRAEAEAWLRSLLAAAPVDAGGTASNV